MLIFRRMVPADAAAVAEMDLRCFSLPWSREMYWEETSQTDAFYLIAVDEGAVAGYIGIWLVGDEAHLMTVAVAPEMRRQKLGTRLLVKIMQAAYMRGARRMTLEVRPSNGAARSLYKKYGFRSVGLRPHYYQDNDEAADIQWNMDIGATLAALGKLPGKGSEETLREGDTPE